MRIVTWVYILIIVCLIQGCVPTLFIPEGAYIERLKKLQEKYFAIHSEIDEHTKQLIRNNKVAVGFTKELVELVLGYRYPAKRILTNKYGADEMWRYKRVEVRPIKPVKKGKMIVSAADFIVHENLYFSGDILIKIEKIDTGKRFGFFD